ncbi:hypothetical protein LAZ67_6002189 [Cordylochernes scorpioides]|uniref:Uncharacterized protein n=1 Tax=Cordylochernes scorpioides TaxID=51811 RepID=A0ABY6KJM0_9ARAC|nr:hypothetical protein LAZ67_6002189 [Cordylochernes scorpioides]
MQLYPVQEVLNGVHASKKVGKRTVSSNSNKRFGHDPGRLQICSRILTEEQKEVRMDVCKNMVEMTRTDPECMQKIITGDETWVHQYDPETKRQSSQWIERGEPKPKKARFTKSKRSQDITDSPVTKSRQDSGRQGTSKQIDHCLYRKMEQGREEEPKEPMESDPDSESGGSPTFPKKETTFGKTQEIVPGQEDVTPPPPVSDVLGRLTTTLPQLSAVTGHRERWNRYDGSYEAQSFFTNYDAQADRAQLQYSTRLKKPPDLLQAPLRVTNTRAYVTCSPDLL